MLRDIKSTFNACDILGHLLPGAVLAIGLWAFETLFEPGFLPGRLVHVRPAGVLTAAVIIIIALAALYCLGLLIDLLGTLIIDRCLIDRVAGYPHKSLLRNLYPPGRMEYTRQYNRSVHFTLWLVVLAAALFPHRSGVHIALALFLALTVAFEMTLKNRARRRLMSADERGRLHPGETALMKKDSTPVRWKRRGKVPEPEDVWEKLAFIPGDADRLIRRGLLSVFRVGRETTDEFQALYAREFEKVFGRRPEGMGDNLFWLPVQCVIEKSERWGPMLIRAQRFYTLMRNLAICFVLLFAYGTIAYQVGTAGEFPGQYYAWVGVTLGAGLLSFLSYYHAYYCAFAEQALSAFCAGSKMGLFSPASSKSPPVSP
ncbi:MAG: hypothetical protein QGD94_09460, partial [Planctomycetia bacterium]|nr:hypothetical protein [Planctomycetia bacterium]